MLCLGRGSRTGDEYKQQRNNFVPPGIFMCIGIALLVGIEMLDY